MTRKRPVSLLLSALVAAAAASPLIVLAYIGLGADLDMLWRPRTVEVLLNTVALAVLSVAASVLIGVPLALATTYGNLPGRGLWTGVLAAALAVPSYVGAFAYFAAFGPGGEIESLAGLPVPEVHGLGGATLVMTLYTYPFVFLSTRAGLRNLDASLVEAARTLGLSTHAALLRVVLPRVKNSIAAGALLVALYAVSDFGTPAIMRFDTFARVIFVEYNAFGVDRAALLSLYLLALVAVIVFFESQVRARQERPGRHLELRMGKALQAATLALMLLLAAAALLVPLGVLGLWLVRDGVSAFQPYYALNSAYAALLAALAAVAVALPVAYAAGGGRAGRALERLTYVGFGVPGIVLGTALVLLGLRLGFLYQSLALLIFAYVVRFLPLAVGSTRASLERTSDDLIGAARTLGATPAEAFRRVALPLSLPGIMAGAALVFLEVMRELPATLLLRPTGFDTLATYLWRVYEAGHFGRGAVPAVLLVLVSGIAVLVMLRGDAGRSRAT